MFCSFSVCDQTTQQYPLCEVNIFIMLTKENVYDLKNSSSSFYLIHLTEK